MKKYQVEITGVTPLLQNKPSQYGFDLTHIEKLVSTDRDLETLKKLYMTADGAICQPATHIEQALIEAGKKIKVKGAGKSNCSKLFASMINIDPLEIPHVNQQWEPFKSLVVNPSTKGRLMCIRPMFKNWVLRFSIDAEDEIPCNAIKEGLAIAGKYVGIGDWRPAKRGKFGKFIVSKFN